MFMILKLNRSLWPTEKSIQDILDSGDFRDPEQEPDSEEEDDCQSLVLILIKQQYFSPRLVVDAT